MNTARTVLSRAGRIVRHPQVRSAADIPVLVWLSLAVIVFTVWATIAPGTLVLHDPLAIDLDSVLVPFNAAHWLGTDEIGRDLYARIVYGARESLSIGLLAITIAIAISLPLGFLGALAPPVVRNLVDRLIEIMLGFPTLLKALLLVTLLGQSPLNVAIAVGIGSASGYARLVRGQALVVRNSGYVEAAVALGHRRRTVLLRHLVPNAIRPLVPIVGLGIGQAIVWSSSLSFLGLGVQPPSSEWGALLAAGRSQLLDAPWLLVVPGTAIVLVALSFATVFRYVQTRFEES